MDEVTLTAVVLTYNEAARIESCLRHLAWVDEILVVDSGSTDGTLERCRAWPKTRVLQRPFDDFASQRNAGIEAARGSWILTVDADEEVSEALAGEILETLPGRFEAYGIPRVNVIFGKPMRFGDCLGDRPERLFRKESARYTGAVHETLVVEGNVGWLQNSLLHHSFEDISSWVRKMDRYTSDEAMRFVSEGRRFRWTTLLVGPWARFVRFYGFRQGWRDGWSGFLYTALGSVYFFVKHLKFRDRLVRGVTAERSEPASSTS